MNPTRSSISAVLGAVSAVHDHTRELVAARVFGRYDVGAAPSLEADRVQIDTDSGADLRTRVAVGTVEAEDDVGWQLGEPGLSSRLARFLAMFALVVVHGSWFEIVIEAAFEVYVRGVGGYLQLEGRGEIFVVFLGFLALFASDLGQVSAGPR